MEWWGSSPSGAALSPRRVGIGGYTCQLPHPLRWDNPKECSTPPVNQGLTSEGTHLHTCSGFLSFPVSLPLSSLSGTRKALWFHPAHKLPYSKDAGGRYSTPAWETKVSLFPTVTVDRGSAFSWTTSLNPVPAAWPYKGQMMPAHAVGWQQRNPEIRGPKSFVIDCKPTCLTFAPEADIIFIILDNK